MGDTSGYFCWLPAYRAGSFPLLHDTSYTWDLLFIIPLCWIICCVSHVAFYPSKYLRPKFIVSPRDFLSFHHASYLLSTGTNMPRASFILKLFRQITNQRIWGKVLQSPNAPKQQKYHRKATPPHGAWRWLLIVATPPAVPSGSHISEQTPSAL